MVFVRRFDFLTMIYVYSIILSFPSFLFLNIPMDNNKKGSVAIYSMIMTTYKRLPLSQLLEVGSTSVYNVLAMIPSMFQGQIPNLHFCCKRFFSFVPCICYYLDEDRPS